MSNSSGDNYISVGSGSSSIDLIVVMNAFGICVILMFASGVYFSPYLWAFALTFAGYYGIREIYPRVRHTRPAQDLVLDDMDLLGASIRLTRKFPTHVATLGGRTSVYINEADLRFKIPLWRAILQHELAHIENRDTVYFFVLNLVAMLAQLCLVFTVIGLVTQPASGFGWSDVQAMSWSMLGLSLMAIALLFIIRRSLHQREFLADQRAFAMQPDWFSPTEVVLRYV